MLYALVHKRVLEEHGSLSPCIKVYPDGMVAISPAQLKFIQFSIRGIDLLTASEIENRYSETLKNQS